MKGQKALGEAQSEDDPEDGYHDVYLLVIVVTGRTNGIGMQRAIAIGRRGLLAQLLVGVGFSYPVPQPRLGIGQGEELVDVDVDLQAVSSALGSVTCNA